MNEKTYSCETLFKIYEEHKRDNQYEANTLDDRYNKAGEETEAEEKYEIGKIQNLQQNKHNTELKSITCCTTH